MEHFERLKKLCDEQGISVNTLEEKIGFGRNTLYSWKNNVPKGSNLTAVADYFGTSVDYLLGRTNQKNWELSEKQNNDLSNTMAELLQHIDHNEALMFDGEILDEETKDLLMASIQHSMQVARTLNKKK